MAKKATAKTVTLSDTQSDNIRASAVFIAHSDSVSEADRAASIESAKRAGISNATVQPLLRAEFIAGYVAARQNPKAELLTSTMITKARETLAKPNSKAEANNRRTAEEDRFEATARVRWLRLLVACDVVSVAAKKPGGKTKATKAAKDDTPRASNVVPASPDCRSFPDVVNHCLSQAQAMDGMARKSASAGVKLTASFTTALAAFRKAMKVEAAGLDTEEEETDC